MKGNDMHSCYYEPPRTKQRRSYDEGQTTQGAERTCEAPKGSVDLLKGRKEARTISMNCSYPRLTHPSLSWSARLKAEGGRGSARLQSAPRMSLPSVSWRTETQQRTFWQRMKMVVSSTSNLTAK